MKFTTLYIALSLLTFSLFFTSCVEEMEEENNVVTITIDEPLNEAVITDCTEVHIHVDVVATVENHEFEVVLHPEDDTSDRIIDFDLHDHDKELTFDQEVDLCSYAPGTCFHLEVVACVDHDCEMSEFAEAEFCLE